MAKTPWKVTMAGKAYKNMIDEFSGPHETSKIAFRKGIGYLFSIYDEDGEMGIVGDGTPEHPGDPVLMFCRSQGWTVEPSTDEEYMAHQRNEPFIQSDFAEKSGRQRELEKDDPATQVVEETKEYPYVKDGIKHVSPTESWPLKPAQANAEKAKAKVEREAEPVT